MIPKREINNFKNYIYNFLIFIKIYHNSVTLKKIVRHTL